MLDDVVSLARALGWSERDVLPMPLRRRLAYLLMLEAERDARLVSGRPGA